MTPETAPAPDPGGVSRRRALGMLGVGAAAVGAGAALRVGAASAAPPPPDTIAFNLPPKRLAILGLNSLSTSSLVARSAIVSSPR